MARRSKSAQAGWGVRLSRAFARRNQVFPDAVSMRKVFVLPRRHGFMVGFATLGVFAIALRIQNNMLLLLAVALFILFLLSLVWAGRNLAGISVALQPGQRLIAGQTGEVNLVFRSVSPRHVVIATTETGQHKLDLGLGVAHLAIPLNLDDRGRQAIPPLLIESDFPFGLARCWAWISPGDILVAPKPLEGFDRFCETSGRLSGDTANEEESGADSLAEWINGTPQTRVHWKRFAATGRLLIKTGDGAGGDRLMIDYARMRHLGHETALSTMCGAVLAAMRQQKGFVLMLPDRQINSTSGLPEEALDALALA